MRMYLVSLLLGLLALAGVGAWGWVGHADAKLAKSRVDALATALRGTEAALTAARDDAKRLARISDARQVKINQLALRAQQTEKKLSEALKANRDWADAPVPDSVWDALGYPASGAAKPAGPGVDAGSPYP